MRLSTATLTSAGGRPYNEDCFGHRTLGGAQCWLVADGLGGHVGGEVASQAAVEGFLYSFAQQPRPLSAESLERHLQAAHAGVLAGQRDHPDLANMRTTLVALLSDGTAALWAHIGDSRLYGFRHGKLAEATQDHSVPQAMANAGEIPPTAIRHHEDRNRLLRDVGGTKGIRPTIKASPWVLQSGDGFLLCTDGFWEHVTETAMAIELAKSATPQQWLDNMAWRLQHLGLQGHDNYTAIAVFVD